MVAIVELIQANPQVSIIAFAILVNFVIILITKFVTDQDRMKELKAKQKEYNKVLKEVKGDMQKTMDIQKEMMQHSMEMMKHSFKPLLITLLPLLVLFWWLRQIFSPVLNHWIWYYIIASIIASIILRKVLKVA